MKSDIKCKDNRKFYDRYEYDRIHKLQEHDIYAAKEAYENYLIRYNKDLSAYLRYANVLISVGEFEKADKCIKTVEYYFDKSSFYKFNDERRKSMESSLLFVKARLYANQKKIWDSLLILINNPNVFPENKNAAIFYLRKLANNFQKEYNREEYSYLYRQIIEYKEEDLIDHIKKHEADFNMNDKEISRAFFNHDFPIHEVMKEVRKNFKKENIIYSGFIDNTYTFKYDQCGRNRDKITDFFEVVTFSDTSNIITMYPVQISRNKNYYDLNYLRETKEDHLKEKKLSQIDKFNKRYNR